MLRGVVLGVAMAAVLAAAAPTAAARPPVSAGRPASTDARGEMRATAVVSPAKRRVKRCRRGQVRVALRGRRARCVPARTLGRGLPRTAAGLLGSIVSQGRPGREVKGSIAARLGSRAADVFRWEDRLVAAGQQAIGARKRQLGIAARARARAAQENLGLELAGPLQWASEAQAFIERLRSGGTDTGRANEQTKGRLISQEGETYTFELQGTDGVQVKCPKEGGVVEASGTFKATRTYTVPGSGAVTETVTGTFTIIGRVNRSAQLTSYDVKVKVTDPGSATPTSGEARGIKPRASAKESAIITSNEVKITGGRAGREKLVAAAIGYAQREGLAFVQDAENVFNRQASCLKAEATPKTVKSGTTKDVTVRVVSRITGKPVESDLTLQPAGGATASPQKTTTTPSKPAKVKVKMPAKGKGSRARAAANASVSITGLSERGRAKGSIGSDEVPEAYDVAIDVQGEGRFATHDATGTLRATIVATRQGGDGAPRWRGTVASGWTDLSATSKIPDCSYGSPVSSGGLAAEIAATDDGERVTVTWGADGEQQGLTATFTVSCENGSVAGQPGPSLVGIGPEAFTLPLAGGTQAVGGGVTLGADGFFNTGTVTLTPRE